MRRISTNMSTMVRIPVGLVVEMEPAMKVMVRIVLHALMIVELVRNLAGMARVILLVARIVLLVLPIAVNAVAMVLAIQALERIANFAKRIAENALNAKKTPIAKIRMKITVLPLSVSRNPAFRLRWQMVPNAVSTRTAIQGHVT